MDMRFAKALFRYEEREFGIANMEHIIDSIRNDPHNIPVLYTTMGADNEFEIQVYLDIVNFEGKITRDGEVVYNYGYDSVENMIEDIETSEFDDFLFGWWKGLNFDWHVYAVDESGDEQKWATFASKEYAEYFCEKHNYEFTYGDGTTYRLEIRYEER